jgi:hypothetical protein
MGIGDWGFGDWGLGIGPNPQSPIPNPQIPNPQSPFKFSILNNLFIKNKKKLLIYLEKLYKNNTIKCCN